VHLLGLILRAADADQIRPLIRLLLPFYQQQPDNQAFQLIAEQ
jgi:hypothetical protein